MNIEIEEEYIEEFSEANYDRDHYIELLPGEIFRWIKGHKGIYLVSNKGRICSQITKTFLSIIRTSYGYNVINLICKKDKYGRKFKQYRVAKLVMETFIGTCPENMEICHNDNNRANDNLENLRYDTHHNNILDKEKFETTQKGKNNGRAILTEQEVLEIRRLSREERYSIKVLVEKYGVSFGCIYGIIERKNWKHI